MAKRRAIFAPHYGTEKTPQGKGGGKLPPPQGTAPVPLSLQGEQAQAPAPAPAPDMGQAGSQITPEMLELLQRMLGQIGGLRGSTT